MYKQLLVAVVVCVVMDVAVCQTVAANPNATEARTFGHHLFKRLSFAIIPTAFVVGIIMTLLAALTVISIKSLGVGVVLLIISIGQILARTFQNAPLPSINPAPVPIVYQRPDTVPIYFDKEW